MKYNSILFAFFIVISIASCSDSINDIGSGVQPASDAIFLDTATVKLVSDNYFVASVVSRPDSFLLGYLADDKYGSTRAEILAQVQGPTGIGFHYPPDAVADSAFVKMYYQSWFGDSYSPMSVNIYELKKQTFNYTTAYRTNIDPSEYVDANESTLLATRIFTAKNAASNDKLPYKAIFKLSENFFKDRLFAADSQVYLNDFNFSNYFKGLYIKAEYGVATLLNVQQIDVELYYHYKYEKNGKDTTINNVQIFPANRLVKQVNRFLHPDTTIIKNKLALTEGVNYISSPANIFTKVQVPVTEIKQKMQSRFPGKHIAVNSALLRVEVTEYDNSTTAKPLVDYLLLIKESEVNDFFTKNSLPNESNSAILAPLTTTLIPNTKLYDRYYSFNLATLIAKEIKQGNNDLSPLKMVLIPVKVTLNSSGTVSEIKHLNTVNAVTIRSSKNTESPMRIRLMYSAF